MRFCTYCHRAKLVLAHKQITYETINIHLKDKPQWFVDKINPLGLVPTVQLGDTVVFDSTVVCEYLDEVYPGEKLTPSDPLQKAKDKMVLEVFSILVLEPFYKLYWSGGEDKGAPQEVLTGLDTMEKELNKRNTPYFGGKRPMMIDFLLWPHMERIVAIATFIPQLELNPQRLPLLRLWIERITAVPAVKDTMIPTDLHKQFFFSVKEEKFDYDLGLED